MAESKYFPNLGNGVDIADVEQVEAAFSAVQADMDKKIEGVADNAITTEKIADGAVTTDKIADGSVSADKLNSAVANRLFTGYIEDNVIGDTVDYNALTNLSQTTINGIYHHTVTKGVETNTAIVVVESAEVFDETDTDCKQMLIKSDGKMYVRAHTQSSGWTKFKETYSDTFANINLLLSSLQTDKADKDLAFDGFYNLSYNGGDLDWDSFDELNAYKENGIYKVTVKDTSDAPNGDQTAILIAQKSGTYSDYHKEFLIVNGNEVYTRIDDLTTMKFNNWKKKYAPIRVTTDDINNGAVTNLKLDINVRKSIFSGRIGFESMDIDNATELKVVDEGVYKVYSDTTPESTHQGILIVDFFMNEGKYNHTLIFNQKIYIRTGTTKSDGTVEWTTFKAPDLDNDSVATNTIKDKAVTTTKLADNSVTFYKIDENVTNRLFTNKISIVIPDAGKLDIDDNAALQVTDYGVYKVYVDSEEGGTRKISIGILIVDSYVADNMYEQTLIYNQKTYIRIGKLGRNEYGGEFFEWTKFETTEKIKEYGVRWLGGASTSCERLGDAKGLVANAYQGSTDTAVVNDFDNIYPWSGMRRCNVNESGDILAYENDPNFKLDGTNGDVMVEIPKFYYKRTKTGKIEEWWICGTKLPGYELHPLFMDDGKEMSKVFHSCYNASAYTDGTDNKVKLRSASGDEPKTRTTMADFRTYARNKGNIWGMEDLTCISALQMLYLVEYANTDSQKMLGLGCATMYYSNGATIATAAENTNSVTLTTNPFLVGQRIEIGTSLGAADVSTTARNVTAVSGTTVTFDGDPITVAVGNFVWNVAPLNGTSDTVGNKSGWVKGENNYPNGKADVRYRGIEGVHGKNYRFIDGCNIKDYKTYYCNSMADYANSVYDGKYKAVGYANAKADGWVKSLGYDVNAPWVMMINTVGGSATTFIPDAYRYRPNEAVLNIGAFFASGSDAGLFYQNTEDEISRTGLTRGVHLLVKKP